MNDKRDAEARFVNCGLSAGEGHAVIGGEDEDGVFPLTSFLEEFYKTAEAIIDPRARLVVVRDLSAGFRSIREEGRDDDLGGIVEDLGDAFVGLFIGKVSEEVGLVWTVECLIDSATAVRVGGAEVEEKGLLRFFFEEGATRIGHLPGVPRDPIEILVEVEDGLGGNVELGDLGRSVSRLCHLRREREGAHRRERLELVKGVGVAVLPVEVVVKPGENDGARGGAGGRGREGLRKAHAIGGESIKMGRLNDAVSVAAGDGGLVIGDEEDDVGLFGSRGASGGDEKNEETGHDLTTL